MTASRVGRVRRLMREMGLEAIWQKPNTSKPNPENKIHPCLLLNLTIDRPNQVWATDITYIPMPKDFLYLVVVMDWHSRKVLSWRLSNTMDGDFFIEALEEALARRGAPEIFNSDQGSQFTSAAFTSVLVAAGVRISMDGKGRCMDNIFGERLWQHEPTKDRPEPRNPISLSKPQGPAHGRKLRAWRCALETPTLMSLARRAALALR